ncbi:Hypothetical protein Cul210932_0204 [Corynebacterium ulcerans]|nr:Hypothetical protein Cul210932_0204 [Corynebacterium ulcerans]
MGYAMWQDFAWRLSRELPQGRNAARVSGLWRVCGVPFFVSPAFATQTTSFG